MNKQEGIILGVVLGLFGSTAGLLAYLKANQKLGRPGVKLIAEPIRDSDGHVVGTNSVFLPEQVLDYSSEPAAVTQVELGWLPKDTTYGRRYYQAPDGFGMLVSIVLMGRDRTSIHKPQYCLTGQGWRIDQSEMATVHVERPHPYELSVMKLTATGISQTSSEVRTRARGIYVYWFVADNELTADHLQRMWWMARDLVRAGTLQRWAYVSCFAACLPGQEAATYQRMKEFIVASVPEFQLTGGELSAKVSSAAPPPSR